MQRILDAVGLAAPTAPGLLLGAATISTTPARPLFWANRAAEHRARGDADEFPNGRFTPSSSPAFGDLSDYYLSAKRPKLGAWLGLVRRYSISADTAHPITSHRLLTPRILSCLIDTRAMWGTPCTVEDVARVFSAFIDGSVPQLPWCDTGPAPETSHISNALRWLNEAGVLTVNSQPRINGVNSSDPRFGWGGPDGIW